jgi:hypothetical protein
MTATNQPDRSPAPGIIPEPVHVDHDDAPTAATEDQDEPRLKRPNPFKLVAATVISALRGDKYMVNAYPAAEREDAPPPDDAGTNAGDR